MQRYSLVSHFIKTREFTMALLQVEKWLIMNARVCQVRGRERNHWKALSHSSSAGVNSCSASPIHFGCLRKNHWLLENDLLPCSLEAALHFTTCTPELSISQHLFLCHEAIPPETFKRICYQLGWGHWNMFWPRLDVGRDVYFPGDTYLL